MTTTTSPVGGWRVVDIVVAAVIGVAFGVVFLAWNALWAFTGPFFTALPAAQAILYGVWLMPAVLVGLIVRRPGAALFAGFLAAAVSVLLGSPYGADALLSGEWTTFGVALKHILLPAITLSFASLATIARFTRASLLEVMSQDYVRTARAKGLKEGRVISRHALRNAFIPTLTMIGLSFGWSMGGSVLVETVFDWPGIGLYATKSALTLDFMPIMGIALLYGLVFSLINIVIDIAYGFLDPRVSHG